MSLVSNPFVAILLGAVAASTFGAISGSITGPSLAARLEARAAQVLDEQGVPSVTARFASGRSWPSRHPVLFGGENLDEGVRADVARAVGAIAGVGGVRWSDGRALAGSAESAQVPLDCQADVEALLRARSIRFEESSARIDAASGELVDEVAAALRPCLGNIIAITGHTDTSGPEPGNLELSLVRANAVRAELIRRGIPADGLRASGVGSRYPVEGLEPTDPANRRIEFSVIATEPIKPTPVDTPGAR